MSQLPSEPVFAWVNPQVCQRCKRSVENVIPKSLTRHHELTKEGIKTGRYVDVCRDCHDELEGNIPRTLAINISRHGIACEQCRPDWEKIRTHLRKINEVES